MKGTDRSTAGVNAFRISISQFAAGAKFLIGYLTLVCPIRHQQHWSGYNCPLESGKVLEQLKNETGNNPAAIDAQQATIAVYEEYGAALLRCASQLASPDEARDAVQEVFLRYFVERRFGRNIENPRAWLYHVLRNYLLDQIKAAPNRREVQAANVEALVQETNANPENLLERSQMAKEIAKVLSGREFTCLTLRGEGLSYSEIAQVMDVRIGTVGATLSRAQEKLRRYGSLDKQNSFRGLAEAILCLVQEALNYSTS